MLFGPLVYSAPAWTGGPHNVEVFTTRVHPVTGAAQDQLRAAVVTTYAVDGLARFQSALSEGLPTDPEAAKVEAIQRFQKLDDAGLAPAKTAAVGLAQVAQL